jgi:hypothetical protein
MMPDTETDARTILERAARERHGFVSEAEVKIIATDPAYNRTLLLVRCGGCRFTADARAVLRLIDIIERDGRDYVRDVCLPTTEAIAFGWRPLDFVSEQTTTEH